ncbi:MAG: glycosyltransferase family 4 protein [Bacteroidales bacterium]|nr:glycosyltransferase family 4 protein [Bacteroidales bacterium]
MTNYIIIAVLLLVLELCYFKIADRYNIIDKPNLRSSHSSITIRGGGIIFLLGAWLYAAFYGVHNLSFLLGVSMIGIISLVDDICSVKNSVRLLIQFAAMGLMFYSWGILNVDDWWMLLLALVFCTGIINAYNFMDGINGITGGYSIAMLVPLLLANRQIGYTDENFIVVALISVVVFCLFNFRTKARCFAGDVGSVTIAFIILYFLGALIIKTGDLWYLAFIVVYGVDSVLTICHRIMLKENITQPHRKHAYQLMANELKLPHVTVSTIYMIVQLIISLGAIYLKVDKWWYFAGVCVVLGVSYILFKMKYYHLHEEYLRSKQEAAK